jgi:pilus assembly protein CpaE
MSTVLLASPTSGFEARVRQVLGGRLNGNLRSWPWDAGNTDPAVVARALVSEAPAVVAIGPEGDPDFAVNVASAIEREAPGITVLIVAEPTPELWMQALRAGARDLVSPEAGDAELAEVMERALETAQRRGLQVMAVPPTRAARTWEGT